MIFYDFEVFSYDWLVVLLNTDTKEELVIVNDEVKLTEFYNKYKKEIWVGYNSNGYDRYILKGILCGFNPKDINDFIVVKKNKGWEFSSELNKVPLLSYDCQFSKLYSLKQLEAFMGHDIRETTVPFDIDRELTEKELEDVIFYCKHDVRETVAVFVEKINEFNAQLSLITEFKLPLRNISKTQAQLASQILEANRENHDDEFDIFLPKNLIINNYHHVVEYFHSLNEYSTALITTVSGVKHVFASGGVHGAINNYIHECNADELMIMADVDQLYPTIMVQYNLLSRNITRKEKFKFILDESLRLKAEKKKKEREPYKRICNITYGAEGDKYNSMYDPRNRLMVCVYGQLFLLDLIEKLEAVPSFKLIQSNTDGILVKIKRDDFELLDDIVYEWESRTKLHMSFDYCKKIIQKDVNNYILIDVDNHVKSKGAYVKDLSLLDNDLPIVNRAIKNYFVDGVSVEETINTSNSLIDFQKIVKISEKFSYALYGKNRQSEKVFRVFACIKGKSLVKMKDNKPNKIANVPEKCVIINSDITHESVPNWLDKQWYINLTKKRILDFIGDERR